MEYQTKQTNGIESSVSAHYCGVECAMRHKRRRVDGSWAEDGRQETREKSIVNFCVHKYFVLICFCAIWPPIRFRYLFRNRRRRCLYAFSERMQCACLLCVFVCAKSIRISHFFFGCYFHCDTFLSCTSDSTEILRHDPQRFLICIFSLVWVAAFAPFFLFLSSAHYVVCGVSERDCVGECSRFEMTHTHAACIHDTMITHYNLSIYFFSFRSVFIAICPFAHFHYYYYYYFIGAFVWWRCFGVEHIL